MGSLCIFKYSFTYQKDSTTQKTSLLCYEHSTYKKLSTHYKYVWNCNDLLLVLHIFLRSNQCTHDTDLLCLDTLHLY